MAVFESAFLIRELSGEGRTLKLVGSALPHRPASWKGSQRMVTTWYPGNAEEASQQVLGPQDDPSDFEGTWRRTLLGRLPASLLDKAGSETKLVHPMDLANVMDDFRRRGNRLRVTWAAVDGTGQDRGKVVREGRLKEFTMSPERIDDIGWKAQFEWAGRGQPLQRVAVSRDGDAIAALSKAKAAANAVASAKAITDAIQKFATIPKSASALTIGQLEQLADAPMKLVTQLTREAQLITSTLDRLGKLALKVRSIPFDIANSALACAHNAIATANRFQDKLSRMSPEQMATTRNAADVVRAASTFGKGGDAAREMAIQAHALQSHVKDTTSSPAPSDRQKAVLGIHVVKTGETMSAIAAKWYGNADLTDPICRSNKLPTSIVYPGRPTLVIPSVPTKTA
jgi:hypothetical protein